MTAAWPWADHFDADGIYLATATCGLPPRATSAAMADILDAWRRGRVNGPAFDAVVAESRERYARLVGVEASAVAIGHQVSTLVALIAGSLPDGAEVLVAEGEFTSVTFPFAVHQARGVRLKVAPLGELAEQITSDTALVAVSAVQSADGAIADFDAIESAAAKFGADVLVDLTQSAGWLPVDASRFAYTVCGAYKWLLAPRGTAFLTVRPDRLDRLVPFQAGWYAGAYPGIRSMACPCGSPTMPGGSMCRRPGSHGSARRRRWSSWGAWGVTNSIATPSSWNGPSPGRPRSRRGVRPSGRSRPPPKSGRSSGPRT